jgi:hypothetical protein
MKDIYTLMILILITSSSSAQDLSYTTSNTVIEDNQILAIDIIDNKDIIEKDALEFRYYYLPNMHAYFDLKTNKYIYKTNNNWKTSSELPQNYGGYSIFKNTKIPLRDYFGNEPQEKLNEHKKQFPYIKKSRMLKSMNLDGNKSISSIN